MIFEPEDLENTRKKPEKHWRCLFLHNWSFWIPKNIKVTKEEGLSGEYTRNIRRCLRCNLVQVRRLS